MRYVLGFLFSEDRERVLLIKKNRPVFLAGKFNGLGGRIDQGEEERSAMSRELLEESGISVRPSDWVYLSSFNPKTGENLVTLIVENEKFDDYVHVFYWFSDLSQAQSLTDEIVHEVEINKLDNYRVDETARSLLDLIIEKFTSRTNEDKINLH